MTAVLEPGMLPLARRELVVALRRRRVLVSQFTTLVVTAVAAVAAAWANRAFGDPVRMGALPFGRDMVVAALGSLCALMGFVVPALTATAISEERERRTLDLLLCTRLRPVDLVGGKLLGGLAQGALVVSASLPVVAFGWLYGGVSVLHIAVAYALVLLLLVLLLASGMFASARATQSKLAISSTYGVNMMLMSVLGLPGLVATGASYMGGTVDAELAVWLAVAALVVAWLTAASFLGSVTGISPASRDPAPAARKLLAAVVGSALVSAVPLGVVGGQPWARVPLLVLLGAVLVVLVAAAVLFATEDAPPLVSAPSTLPWRGSPWVGPLFAMSLSVVALLGVPALAMRNMVAPPVTMAGCLALVPMLGSASGIASLARVVPHRRGARNALAFAVLVLLAVVPPLVAFLSGHGSLASAPAGMLLWLHPVVLLLSLAPSATEAVAAGPFGGPLAVSFVVGHAAICAAAFTASALWGRPSVRVD